MNTSYGKRLSSPGVRQSVDPSGSAIEAEVKPVPLDCPRCGGRLISPESLGWCQNCGYCRSLQEESLARRPAVAADKVKEATEGAVAFWQMLWALPRWAWVLLGGVALILGASIIGDALLPAQSFWRAVCSTSQLAAGAFMILGAQIYSVLRVSAQDANLGGRQLFFFSPRLWKLIVKELPATRWLVYLECWGATLALSAVVIVGNLFYWAQYYQPRQLVDQALRKAAEAQEQGDAAEAPPSKTLPAPNQPVDDVKNDSRPTVQCAIIGYVPGDDGLPVTLLLARLNEGKLVYCGTVKRGFLPQEAEELRTRLSKSVRAEPLIKGLQEEAVWVKAGTYCDVHLTGFDATGYLVDPSFDKLRLK